MHLINIKYAKKTYKFSDRLLMLDLFARGYFMMKLDDLNAFVTLVQLQSTQETASKLGLTQPAVTRRVQNFEQALGVQLLDRQTKPLKPTPRGWQVYQQCRRIANEIDTLTELVASNTPPRGVLRFGLPHSLSNDTLLPALAMMQQHYPDLQLRLTSNWGNQLLNALDHAALDAALLLAPASKIFNENLYTRALGPVPLSILTADDGKPLPATLADCYAKGWILNPDGCGFRAMISRALAEQGLPLQLNMEVQGTDLQLALIAEGRGLGIMPQILVDHSALHPRIRVVRLEDFSPLSELWLIQSSLPGNQQLAVGLFADTLAHSYGVSHGYNS